MQVRRKWLGAFLLAGLLLAGALWFPRDHSSDSGTREPSAISLGLSVEARTLAQGATAFPESEAGLAVYLKLESLDVDKVIPLLGNVEGVGDNYAVGSRGNSQGLRRQHRMDRVVPAARVPCCPYHRLAQRASPGFRTDGDPGDVSGERYSSSAEGVGSAVGDRGEQAWFLPFCLSESKPPADGSQTLRWPHAGTCTLQLPTIRSFSYRCRLWLFAEGG